MTDVVDDAESIRIALGIKSWAVLGHSYGGYLAVLYALRYPKSTTAEKAGLPAEAWANSGRTRASILAEGTIYHSVIPRLSDLSMPTLMMKGDHDPVTCERQVDAFRTLVPNGRVERFSASGHWIRHEEPGRYIDTVLDFLSSGGADR